MAFGSAALKFFQTFLYAVLFCCSGIILGIYSYFLAVQADRNATIPAWEKAVEGMSGVGVVYTILAVVLTCCLGGVTFFAFLAIVFDVLLCAAFVAIAVMCRHGSGSCSGNNVKSPLGNGPSNQRAGYGSGGFGAGGNQNVTYSASIGFACRLNKVAFAVAIIGAILFLFSAIVQLWLGRHHKREKRFGPSPSNNYTSGSGNRWFRRKRGPKTTHAAYNKDAELGALGAGGLAADHTAEYRTSHETGYTGTTAGHNTYTGNKYDSTQPAIPTTGGYHTGPTGTGVNPYGYENTRTAGTNF